MRGIDRTLEYAEYTEEERPVSIQIFGGDPEKMAAAAQIVEGMGADIVDVNMGCPVPKIAKHNAGCSLMREPEHAAAVVRGDGEGGEDSGDGEDARRLERRRDATRRSSRGGWKTPAPRRWRSTAARRRSPTPGSSDWDFIARVAAGVGIPVFGSGDCIEPAAAGRAARPERGVGRARRPRRAAQSVDLPAGGGPCRRPRAARGHRRRSRRSSSSPTSTCSSRSGCTRRRASATSRPGRRTRRPRPGPPAATTAG